MGVHSAPGLGAAFQPVLAHAAGMPASSVPTNPVNYTPDNVFKLGSYWIDVPSSYDSTNKTPTELFVWSHGCGGESAGDIYNVAPKAGGPTYIAITVDGREDACWDVNTDTNLILNAIADVKTHFNIDPQRVVLGGFSSGGDLSYRVAFTHSTEIAGVLAENTSPFRDTGLTQDQALTAPFHFNIVHLAHTGDESYPLDGVVAETNAVKAAGAPGDGWASLQLLERPGTHYDNDVGNTGTVYDMQTYLLPHLADGWTSPGPQTTQPPAPQPPMPPPTMPQSPGTPTTKGAGYAELGAFRSTDGTWSLASDGKPGFNADDRVITGFSPAGPNIVPVAGDWARLGTDEIGDFVAGTWHLDLNNNGTLDNGETFNFGQAGDVPVPGHYLPGGGIELAVFRSMPQGYGEFLISDPNWLQEGQAGQAIGINSSFIFGAAGDRVVVGDWTGDGLTKVGVFRDAAQLGAPGAAVFTLDVGNHHTFDASSKVFIFGAITDQVVIGDWDGSGTSKVGVYRPATAFGAPGTAVFSLDQHGELDFGKDGNSYLFGLATDKYVTGRWAYTTSAGGSAAMPHGASDHTDLAAALLTAPTRSNPAALDAYFASN